MYIHAFFFCSFFILAASGRKRTMSQKNDRKKNRLPIYLHSLEYKMSSQRRSFYICIHKYTYIVGYEFLFHFFVVVVVKSIYRESVQKLCTYCVCISSSIFFLILQRCDGMIMKFNINEFFARYRPRECTYRLC